MPATLDAVVGVAEKVYFNGKAGDKYRNANIVVNGSRYTVWADDVEKENNFALWDSHKAPILETMKGQEVSLDDITEGDPYNNIRQFTAKSVTLRYAEPLPPTELRGDAPTIVREMAAKLNPTVNVEVGGMDAVNDMFRLWEACFNQVNLRLHQEGFTDEQAIVSATAQLMIPLEKKGIVINDKTPF